jgi:hypothetical protein
VLRHHYDVSTRINQAIENANDCMAQCREKILQIVDYLGEDEHPRMKQVRVKISGYTPEEQQAI